MSGGKCPGGYMSGGKCLGGTCPGGLCPRIIHALTTAWCLSGITVGFDRHSFVILS